MAIPNQEPRNRSGNGGLWFFTTLAFIFSTLALAGTGAMLLQISQLRQEITSLSQTIGNLSATPQQAAQSPSAAPSDTPNQTTPTTQPTPASETIPGGQVYQSQGTLNGKQFTLTLKSLRRTGNIAIASFSFTNNNNTFEMDVESYLAKDRNSEIDKGTISAAYLIDSTNQKKYEVMRDASNNPLCTRLDSNIGPEKTVDMYAQFTAPPSSVKTMNVYFPQTSAFIDVPLQ